MPALSANASTYRAGQYHFTGHLATIPNTVIFSRSVNMAAITYPVTALTYDNAYSGVGAFTDLKEGMTLIVYSGNTTTVKGFLRVAAGIATSTVVQVDEFSAGAVNLADNDRFDVLNSYSILTKLVSASAALNKDSRIAYVSQGSNPPPLANAGGLWFGFVDTGQTYATVSFDASVSINVDPDSSTAKTYLWAVGAGATITVGTTTTASITVRFPVGFRHVQLAVTDSTNSVTTTRQIPVYVFSAAAPPLAVADVNLEYSAEDGWSAGFSLPRGSESALSTLPDGTLIVYFEREYYGASEVSYGSNVSGRSHIKFVGYLVRDSILIDPDNNTVSFEALSPLGILNKTPALPQLMVQNSGTGSLWRHIKTLSTNRMFWYLSHWHSTLDGYFDFVWQLTGSSLAYRRVAVTEASSIGAQLRDIAQSINCKVTCDRLGRILLIQDFNFLSTANRSSRTVLYNLTTADIKRLEFSREHRGVTKFVRGEGITDGNTAGSNKPVFSNAPGKAPAPFGSGSDTLSRQIVDTQADLNSRTGWYFAKANGLYNGNFVPQDATLQLPSGYDWIDPAYNEPITITIASTSNDRGVSFSTTTRWLVESMSVSCDAETGTKENTARVSHETDGVAGTTYIKPQQAQNGLPDFPPLDLTPIITIPDTTPPLYRGGGVIAVFSFGGNSVTITSDFNTPSGAGGPTVTTHALTLSGTLVAAIADPYSPRYLGTGSTVNGWLATTTRLYKIDDIFGARTITQLMVFFTPVGSSQIQRVFAVERAVQNFVLCASYYQSSGGVYIARTTDGTTWSEAQLTAHYNTGAASPASVRTPTVWVSGKIPGRAYAFAFTATGLAAAATSALYQSDDYGVTWSPTIYATNDTAMGYCLHFPWQNNDNDRYFFWTKNDTSTTTQLMRTDRLLGTQTVVDVITGANKAGSSANAIAMDSSVLDRNSLVVSGARINGANFAIGLYGSRDFGATWSVLQAEITALSNRISGVRFAPDSANSLYTVGEDSYGVGFSNDFGVFVDPRISSGTVAIAIIGG